MDHARIEAALSEFCSFLKENESKLRAFVDIGAMNFDSWLLLELSDHFYKGLEPMGVPDNHVIWLDRELPIPGERRRLKCDLSVAPPPRRRRHDRAGLWLNARMIWINLDYDNRADAVVRDVKRLAGAGQDYAYFMITLIRTTGKKAEYKEHLKDLVGRIESSVTGELLGVNFETDTFRLSHGDTANIGIYFWRLGDAALAARP
jgi:hypothetical protein